jgi:hypothetical protein
MTIDGSLFNCLHAPEAKSAVTIVEPKIAPVGLRAQIVNARELPPPVAFRYRRANVDDQG